VPAARYRTTPTATSQTNGVAEETDVAPESAVETVGVNEPPTFPEAGRFGIVDDTEAPAI
jgi:hypothetical protein